MYVRIKLDAGVIFINVVIFQQHQLFQLAAQFRARTHY